MNEDLSSEPDFLEKNFIKKCSSLEELAKMAITDEDGFTAGASAIIIFP